MQEILEFLRELGSQITPEVVNFLVVVALVVLLGLLALVARAIAKHEKAATIMKLFDLFDDFVLDSIIFVWAQNPDLTKYQEQAEKRVAEGFMWVDPRMLYVMDIAGDKARALGLPIAEDEEALLRRAESIFQRIKKDPDLPDVGNTPAA